MTTISTLYIPEEMDCRTCNMCVSHCPTYKLNRESLESPRGRLKLINKLLNENTELSKEEFDHLNNCVECRACESVCPSKMQYGELIKQAKMSTPQSEPSPLIRALLYATSDKQRLSQIFTTVRASQKWGLQSLARRMGIFKIAIPEYLDHLLPTLPREHNFDAFYPAQREQKGAVGLFTGCLTSVMDSPTLLASIKVLTILGYDVYIPKTQQCCGALHQHNGDTATAERLAQANIDAFKMLNINTIVFTATGCGSAMKEYRDTTCSELDQNSIKRFAQKTMDINKFVAQHISNTPPPLAPLEKKVAVHEPCSQRFPLKSHAHVYTLLNAIPNIELLPLPENNICCGAGGSYMLTQPDKSDEIRRTKIDALDELQAEIVVSSNIGCALHLLAGINKHNKQVTVAHPIELFSQQLQ